MAFYTRARCRSRRTMKKEKVLYGAGVVVIVVTLVLLYPSEYGRRRSKYFMQAAPPPSPQGFVLTLRFTGQQVAGMRGIFSQQCWINSFHLPLTIVEPFMVDSTVIHSRDLWESEESKALRLRRYYDLGSSLPTTSWDYFVRHAPHNLIVLTITMPASLQCLNFKPTCNRIVENKDPQTHWNHNCSLGESMSDSVQYLEQLGFHVVHKLCLNCSITSTTTPQDIVDSIFAGHTPQNVTLLINYWKFSFRMFPDCSLSKCANFTVLSNTIQNQPYLNSYAKRYREFLDNLSNDRNTIPITSISVMIRLEWLIIRKRNRSLKMLHTCLQSIKEKLTVLSETSRGRTRTLLALDVGKFGSSSFNITRRIHHIDEDYFQKLVASIRAFVLEVYRGRMDFEAWEESFVTATGGIADRTHIANLQTLLASQADCLILLGGGHFQALALEKYKLNHPAEEHCIHTICR